MNAVIAAVSATMTAPDAAPHLPFLQQMLQASVGQLHKIRSAGQPPGPGAPPAAAGAPGAPGPMPTGGGMNLQQLMGAGPSAPSAGLGGAGPSPSGMSA
ncbi:MAG TPA: hypothetical protein VNF73_01170, partial [Candidatus Saccharimonadales bacterium]|nr:hypothetical protein [Candidatus Saccharimonadales bacterium]